MYPSIAHTLYQRCARSIVVCFAGATRVDPLITVSFSPPRMTGASNLSTDASTTPVGPSNRSGAPQIDEDLRKHRVLLSMNAVFIPPGNDSTRTAIDELSTGMTHHEICCTPTIALGVCPVRFSGILRMYPFAASLFIFAMNKCRSTAKVEWCQIFREVRTVRSPLPYPTSNT